MDGSNKNGLSKHFANCDRPRQNRPNLRFQVQGGGGILKIFNKPGSCGLVSGVLLEWSRTIPL